MPFSGACFILVIAGLRQGVYNQWEVWVVVLGMPDIRELLVCRSLLEDDVFQCLSDCLAKRSAEGARSECVSRLIVQAETLGLGGNVLAGYLLYRLVVDDNIAARMLDETGGRIGESLHRAFRHDIALLSPLLQDKPSAFLPTDILDDYHPTRDRLAARTKGAAMLAGILRRPWTVESLADALLDFYRQYGSGDLALYRAFRWDANQGLVGIEHFEPVQLTHLIGYMEQKKQLMSNTLAFLGGRPANNVLLVGARGTGKSSSVKALANEYFDQGLRLVQITKPQLTDLARILATLRRFATKRFIVFLDDLSFEESEVEYKYLKSAIEGGVESRPDNVLIYATSNRRHLIKETWRDREDGQDELYMADSVNETISLSDRFGLIIHFRTPNQNEYLAIIDHYLRAAGVILSPEELRVAGHRWEIEHSGRSGRTARQFVEHYLGVLRKGD